MGLHNLDVETNSLKNLVVEDCSDMVYITISANNLKSFWYDGVLPRIVRLRDVMSLVHVVLDLKHGPGSDQFKFDEFLSNILIFVKDVEVLTTSGWILEWLCSGGVIFGYLEFQFNKLKSLTWVDSLINKNKRDSIACFLNAFLLTLPLIVTSKRIDSNLNSIPRPYFHHCCHDFHLWMDFSSVRFSTSQLRYLKSVDFLGFSAKEDELLLMDLVLEKAIKLNSFTFNTHRKLKIDQPKL
ncbi:F-box protein At2g39490-like [Malus sylvestris]|uniref:F-box protein At2g39490-like n=1 Tax=Malus sylvestris TaxID=3752 RepID=UPI0021ACCF1A|nr:F-box protein At2g39490-like [Malus sylvestris]